MKEKLVDFVSDRYDDEMSRDGGVKNVLFFTWFVIFAFSRFVFLFSE